MVRGTITHAARALPSTDNIATTSGGSFGGGGGMYIANSSSVLVAGNQIEGNWTAPLAGYGGGMEVAASDAHLSGNTLIGNMTGGWHGHGGGVAILSTVPVTLSNNVVAHNPAATDGGGVSVIMQGAPGSQGVLVHNTIADNGATGIAATGHAAATLLNNIVVGHGVGITETEVIPGTPSVVAIDADTNLLWNDEDPIMGRPPSARNPGCGQISARGRAHRQSTPASTFPG